MANFVAFIRITEFVEGETDIEDDQSIIDDDTGIEHQELCQNVVRLEKRVFVSRRRNTGWKTQ